MRGGRDRHTIKWAPNRKCLLILPLDDFWTHNGFVCLVLVTKINARYVYHRIWRVGSQLENGLETQEIERILDALI